MGTRHITIVKSKGKIKVAQYGQWDGYPKGQGATIAEFLKTVDLPKFKKQVDALKEHTKKSIEKAYADAGHDGGEWVKSEVSDRKNQAHPELNRDVGAGILQMIHDGIVTKVSLCSDYNPKTGKVAEDTWCEYWYEIDLDKETITMNSRKTLTFAQWKRKGAMQRLQDQDNEDE